MTLFLNDTSSLSLLSYIIQAHFNVKLRVELPTNVPAIIVPVEASVEVAISEAMRHQTELNIKENLINLYHNFQIYFFTTTTKKTTLRTRKNTSVHLRSAEKLLLPMLRTDTSWREINSSNKSKPFNSYITLHTFPINLWSVDWCNFGHFNIRHVLSHNNVAHFSVISLAWTFPAESTLFNKMSQPG